MRAAQLAWALCAFALAMLVGESLFVVGEGELALRSRLGKLQGEPLGAGLHVAWPFERVQRIDTRLVTQQLPGEPFVSGEQQALLVDLAIDWRVHDAVRFLRAAEADEQRAGAQLADQLRGELKSAWAAQPLKAILAAPGGGIADDVRARLAQRAGTLGLQLVDARVVRVDPTDDVANAVFRRMQAGFEAEARAEQAGAEGDVLRIRATAERDRAELLGAANRDSQKLRGQGDAQAAMVYARAFGRSPEFAAFWRSLQAYRTAIGREGDVLVVQPDGEFYKYLRSPARR